MGLMTRWEATPELRYVERRRARAKSVPVLQQLWRGARYTENGLPISPVKEWRDVPFKKELEHDTGEST